MKSKIASHTIRNDFSVTIRKKYAHTHMFLITHYLHKPKAKSNSKHKNPNHIIFLLMSVKILQKYIFSHHHIIIMSTSYKREKSLTSDIFFKMRLIFRLLSPTKFSLLFLLNSLHSVVILIITYAMCVVLSCLSSYFYVVALLTFLVVVFTCNGKKFLLCAWSSGYCACILTLTHAFYIFITFYLLTTLRLYLFFLLFEIFIDYKWFYES